MEYTPEVFMVQFALVKRFVYHTIYYRELHRAYGSAELKSEFLTHTIDSHILQAVVYWCMVFGSDGCNSTHWKKLSPTESSDLQRSFRQRLLEKTDLSKDKWNHYWKNMTKFRNEYVAHRELKITCKVPCLTTALNVAYFYDGWIRDIIYPDTFDEPPLNESAVLLEKKVDPLIDKLVQLIKMYNDQTGQVT